MDVYRFLMGIGRKTGVSYRVEELGNAQLRTFSFAGLAESEVEATVGATGSHWTLLQEGIGSFRIRYAHMSISDDVNG